MNPAIPIGYVENIAEVIGGGPLSLLTLVQNLDRKRFTPIVFCYASGGLTDRLSASGIEVHVLQRRGLASNLSVVHNLVRQIGRRRIRLVHVNSLDIRAGLAARLSGVPLVGHLRVIFPFGWADRLFVRLSTRVISVSDAARNAFCAGYPGLARRFTTIPNAVCLEADRPVADIRAELGLPPGTPLVAAVSRIDPWKGLQTFVQMAALLKGRGAKFLLLGSADRSDPDARAFEGELHRLTEALGLAEDLYFLGFRNDALDIIRQVDVLTVTSRVLRTREGIKTEGFGRVIVEAMALETPVVATRVGGIPEIVAHGESGLLVPPEAPAKMADAVRALLEDGALKQKIVREGRRQYLGRYHIAHHIAHIQGLYEEVLRTHAG